MLSIKDQAVTVLMVLSRLVAPIKVRHQKSVSLSLEACFVSVSLGASFVSVLLLCLGLCLLLGSVPKPETFEVDRAIRAEHNSHEGASALELCS
jgi:hypothetical protein